MFKDYTMVSKEIFQLVRETYGRQASWAVWGPFGDKPRDGMDDLSIFSDPACEATLPVLHTNFVIVGLNISTADIKVDLSNFHGKNGEVYKLRYALHDTPLWGGYLTDILKNYSEAKSGSVEKFLKTEEGKNFEIENYCSFENELSTIGAENAAIIALGKTTYEILVRQSSKIEKTYKGIYRIDHYGYQVNKEIYKSRVHLALREANLLGDLERPA